MAEVWFWQTIVTPHMAHLAVSLAQRGHRVTYVGEQIMTHDRQEQGWGVPELPGVTLLCADSDTAMRNLAKNAPSDSVHVCQGVRSNGRVSIAQRELSIRRLQQWVVMETVDDSGWKGVIKRMEYRRLVLARRASIQGVLAIGHGTAGWVAARGMPTGRVYPFAYFLPEITIDNRSNHREFGGFRFIFAGRLIPLKRIDWLIEALATIAGRDFELLIAGAGPEEPTLRALAAGTLGDRVRWLGTLPLSEVPAVMAQADCLVLPSVHDGWGAVVSEALLVGTPVICSDTCGAAGVVRASGVGGVFPRDDAEAFRALLNVQLRLGPVGDEARRRTASWAECLAVGAGADYLLEILDHSTNGGPRPIPPWTNGIQTKCAE